MCRPAQTGLGRSAVGHGPDALARLRQPCDDAARGEVDKLLPENVYPIVKACRSRAAADQPADICAPHGTLPYRSRSYRESRGEPRRAET